MGNVMAILQDADKCMRCNGCVISCKRTWQMKGNIPTDQKPNQKVTVNQRVVIKPQRRVDTAPFVRFSCWHCPDPPCVRRCPWKAIVKDPDGPVYIDPVLCNPFKQDPNNGNATCGRVCVTDCGRGGYPKVGTGCDDPLYATPKAWKCTMCYGRAGLPTVAQTTKYGFALPTKAPTTGGKYMSELTPQLTVPRMSEVPEMEHQPSCVYTCPAKAMHYDSRQNIIDYLNNGLKYTGSDPTKKFVSALGDGSVFWFSRNYMLLAPKADPFMEDHVSPMVSSLLSGPFAKAALVPTLVAGSLLALSARRAKIQEEEALMAGGEA
jgi:Fe-S-cluster-containing dehydrogenase component